MHQHAARETSLDEGPATSMTHQPPEALYRERAEHFARLRDEARRLIRQYNGLHGLRAMLYRDMQQIRPDETEAAVDSELALLWWDDYPRYRICCMSR